MVEIDKTVSEHTKKTHYVIFDRKSENCYGVVLRIQTQVIEDVVLESKFLECNDRHLIKMEEANSVCIKESIKR